MNSDEISRVFARMERLREEGKLPTPSQEDIENEPTALAYTYHKEQHSDTYYHPSTLYKAFMFGYKMGLLEVDEAQINAEFIMFMDKLEEDQDN